MIVAKLVQIVCPFLHDPDPLITESGPVIGLLHVTPLRVSKLRFKDVDIDA